MPAFHVCFVGVVVVLGNEYLFRDPDLLGIRTLGRVEVDHLGMGVDRSRVLLLFGPFWRLCSFCVCCSLVRGL